MCDDISSLQLSDGDYSMDEDDDIGALLGNPPPNGQLSNSTPLPTVTVTSVAQPSVKKAVDYFDEDDEMESRGSLALVWLSSPLLWCTALTCRITSGHSASTSSGRSTQKETSPFFVDHDLDSKKGADWTLSEPRCSLGVTVAGRGLAVFRLYGKFSSFSGSNILTVASLFYSTAVGTLTPLYGEQYSILNTYERCKTTAKN